VETRLTESPEEAADFIRRGKVVAFPTETVYGLGANVFDTSAIAGIFEAKQRPADNPLIVHVSRVDQIETVAAEVTLSARKLIKAFFPGPLTVVLRKRPEVPLIATAGLETVGVRMPRHAITQAFLAECNTPVVAPSANLSGRPSPTTWQAVYEDLYGRIDCILKGDATAVGLESTVVDCTGNEPVLLRSGAISLEELRRVIPGTKADISDSSINYRSPGLRHKHYKPSAKVKIINANDRVRDAHRAAYIGLFVRPEPFQFVKICSTVESYAHELFEFFRECDRRKIHTIYCESVAIDGLGRALMDRLQRAAD
jgi:L-threonylcarbamoyladenylate synthase